MYNINKKIIIKIFILMYYINLNYFNILKYYKLM